MCVCVHVCVCVLTRNSNFQPKIFRNSNFQKNSNFQILLTTEQEIQIFLLSIITSSGGEASGGTVTLLSHHYTCIAPGENINKISQISVAVVFNITTTWGATDTRQL